MVRVKFDEIDSFLTEEEKEELRAADAVPIMYDDDSPRMIADMLKQFYSFGAVPIRVSRDLIKKA